MYCHVAVSIPMCFNSQTESHTLNKVVQKVYIFKQNLDSRAVLLKVVITLTAFQM